MSRVHTTLFILRKAVNKVEFVHRIHTEFSGMNCFLEKENGILTFNDGPNSEWKDELYLNEDDEDQYILNELLNWQYLGIIEYNSLDLNCVFSVNFYTWNGTDIHAFDIGIPNVLIRDLEFKNTFNNFIKTISGISETAKFGYDSAGIDVSKNYEELNDQFDSSELELKIYN